MNGHDGMFSNAGPRSFSHTRTNTAINMTTTGAYLMDGRVDDRRPHQSAITDDPAFEILEWHPAYQSCQRYFLDHAQYEPGTQAVSALMNIRLPHQWLTTPITSSAVPDPEAGQAFPNFPYDDGFGRAASNLNSPGTSRAANQTPVTYVSLIPYIRRLIVTGFDKTGILHGFFGDDYMRGILPLLECERRNYLFAAKSGGWHSCKQMYDVGSGGGGDELVPFLKPLDNAKIEEVTSAEKAWSGWLAMEDWMIGPRAPHASDSRSGSTAGDPHVMMDSSTGLS